MKQLGWWWLPCVARVWPPDAGCLHFHEFSSLPLVTTHSQCLPLSQQPWSRPTHLSWHAGPPMARFHRGLLGLGVPGDGAEGGGCLPRMRERTKHHLTRPSHAELGWAKRGDPAFRLASTSSLHGPVWMNFSLLLNN